MLIIFTVIFLFLLTSCGQNSREPQFSTSPVMISAKEIIAFYPDITLFTTSDLYASLDPIVGRWTNEKRVLTEIERWATVYETCFSPDGQVVHYGNRNMDIGTWERIDERTVIAYFDDCTYTAVGAGEYKLPSYQVTYIYNVEEKELDRQTDRLDELTYESRAVTYTATDFDTYDKPLQYSSREYTVSGCSPYPKETEYCTALEKRLLAIADDLQSGEEVTLERADLPYELLNVSVYDLTGDGRPEIFAYVEMCHSFDNSGAFYILSQKPDGEYTVLSKNTDFRGGYTDVFAPDGTELLAISGYAGSSSWKGGVRIHLGYREGQIVVDWIESYNFHWDYPLVNYVNDYKNGKYYVYVARQDDSGGEGYGTYISLEHSLKIDEESFLPILLPFTGYGTAQADYPAVYDLWSPFDEDWWQDGGRYPEDGDYERTADWVITAVDDHPDEMLQEAVENSGLKLEKKAYPWTPETKKNVMDLLRCPVADYYYQSDYYAAAYMRGEICFYEKEILPDGYGEEWVLMDSLCLVSTENPK
ncbi:MAG: hypothetical protein K2N80_07790 [Lachnospiraceae bacterium]|nr:hypothetical protein [Lachnospiraceae bacterium]